MPPNDVSLDARDELPGRYLELLARSVTAYGLDSSLQPFHISNRRSALVRRGTAIVTGLLARRSLALAWQHSSDLEARAQGREFPVLGKTMVGFQRLGNVRECIDTILDEGIEGDIMEAGVWRGGTIVYMLGVLAARGETRTVWAADSFEGLPEPDLSTYPQDRDQWLHLEDGFAVSRSEVERTLDLYGFGKADVRYLEGWFKDTMPAAPVERLALLRLDGDYYESTIQVLDAMYEKVSPGGFVLVDDYGAIEACRQAVTDFRDRHGITDPIEQVDWTGVFWRKSPAAS